MAEPNSNYPEPENAGANNGLNTEEVETNNTASNPLKRPRADEPLPSSSGEDNPLIALDSNLSLTETIPPNCDNTNIENQREVTFANNNLPLPERDRSNKRSRNRSLDPSIPHTSDKNDSQPEQSNEPTQEESCHQNRVLQGKEDEDEDILLQLIGTNQDYAELTSETFSILQRGSPNNNVNTTTRETNTTESEQPPNENIDKTTSDTENIQETEEKDQEYLSDTETEQQISPLQPENSTTSENQPRTSAPGISEKEPTTNETRETSKNLDIETIFEEYLTAQYNAITRKEGKVTPINNETMDFTDFGHEPYPKNNTDHTEPLQESAKNTVPTNVTKPIQDKVQTTPKPEYTLLRNRTPTNSQYECTDPHRTITTPNTLPTWNTWHYPYYMRTPITATTTITYSIGYNNPRISYKPYGHAEWNFSISDDSTQETNFVNLSIRFACINMNLFW